MQFILIQEEKVNGSFANFRIVIRKNDENNVKAPIKHSGHEGKADFLLDILNKPELNEWKPVEIEIVNHENIETKTPNTKERQTRHGDVEAYDGYRYFPKSKNRSDELSKEVNEGGTMMIIRLLSPTHINIMPDLHHATETEPEKVTQFHRNATALDIISTKLFTFGI